MAKRVAKKVSKPRQSNLPGPSLADWGDPLVLANGDILQPIKPAGMFEEVNQRNRIDPVAFRGKKQHNIKDLPAPKNVMHAISAVLVYSIMNVGDRESADALGCSTVDIEKLRAHTAYTEIFDAFFNGVISAHSDSLMGRIAAYSHGALTTVAHLSENAQNENVKLRASTDLLDRGGLSAKSIDQSGQMRKDVLRIQINRADGTQDMSIELNGSGG
jgi:hypothetical protein